MVCQENGSPNAGDPLRSSPKPQNARPKANQSYVSNENQRYTLPPLEKCGPHIYINGKNIKNIKQNENKPKNPTNKQKQK
jgi:hypothetical protein